MASIARSRYNTKTGRLTHVAAAILAISLLGLISCSNSSDTLTQAKKAANIGKYQISVKITSPTSGSIIAFKADGTSDVTYESTVLGGTDPYSYTWKIEGPTVTTTASGDSPTLTVFELGKHTITLTVTDANGITDQDVITVTITRQTTASEGLVVNITSPASNKTIGLGDAITFSGSVNAGSGTYDYNWDIPGGSTTTATTAASTTKTNSPGAINFNRAGTYTITLTVTDSYGNVGSDTVTITVQSSTSNVPLQVDINDPQLLFTYSVGDTVTFGVNATGGSGNYAYLWTTSDTTNITPQTAATRESATPSFTFNKAGTYTISVELQDTTFGDTTTDSVTITVK